MNRRANWTESLSVFLVGLGVGAAVGVLFAPNSGEDTRDYIVQSSRDGLDGMVAAGRKLTRRAKDEIEDGIEEAKGRVRHAAEVGERAYRETKNSPSNPSS
jgi:gas vesicle protein